MRTQTALRLRGSLGALVERHAVNARQGFSSLAVASVVNLVAGLALGFMTGTLERLPGLIVLVPAAIAMSGKIFGALASRLSTAVAVGEWSGRWEGRPQPDTVLGQNLAASTVLTLLMSAAMAVLARAVSQVFGLATISVVDFLTISVVGSLLASVIVLAVTLVVAVLSVRRGWDMDNVSAPIITSTGDLVTIPTLWLASLVVGIPLLSEGIAAVAAIAVLMAAWRSYRSGLRLYRRIMSHSIPILLAAGTLGVVAGVTIDERIEEFIGVPALLVLVPPLLADAGALGGILSARLSSKLHLGSLEPRAVPGRAALEDVGLTYVLALPIFLLVGVGVTFLSSAVGLDRLGWEVMVAVTILAGLIATSAAVFVAYYSAVVSFRLGLDPDTYGIPAVTSSLDLLGVLALVLSLGILGVSI